jgi:hypothetical protein
MIPQRIFDLPRPIAYVLFGGLLGVGILTIIPFIGFHLLLAASFLSASPLQAAVGLGVFGLSRGIPVCLVSRTSWRVKSHVDNQHRDAFLLARIAWVLSSYKRIWWLRVLVLFMFGAAAIRAGLRL